MITSARIRVELHSTNQLEPTSYGILWDVYRHGEPDIEQVLTEIRTTLTEAFK